jgi:hypothetical protein
MKKYLILFTVLLFVFGSVTYYLTHTGAPHQGSEDRNSHGAGKNGVTGNSGINNEINEAAMGILSSRLSRLEAMVSQNNDNHNATADEASQPEQAPGEVAALTEEQMAAADEFERRTYERYEEILQTDFFDKDWNEAMQQKIDDVFQDDELLANTVGHTFQCKSVLCKLETTHNDTPSQEAFMGSVVHKIMSDTSKIDGMWFKKDVNDHGVSRTHIFIVKKGEMRKIESTI